AAGGGVTQGCVEGYYKLLAVKDEYEVARLHLEHGPLSQGAAGKLTFHLSPPWIAPRDSHTGLPRK
ncbi:hypothetical protein T484DRAFT_1905930, partial [Baffinella frigidus]